jgi:hypothetical protein
MTTPAALSTAAGAGDIPGVIATGTGDPVATRIVIAGCSRRKTTTSRPLPALELYQGGCIPMLRARLGASPPHRARIRILSAPHGLITAETPLLTYDHALDPGMARALRPAVTAALHADAALSGAVREVLVVAEPLYLTLLTALLAAPTRIHWIDDVRHGWSQAAHVLDQWGWP